GDGQAVYVSDVGVRAVDVHTGQLRWLGNTAGGVDTWGPFNRVLYTSGAEEAAFDATTGRKLWSEDIDGAVTALAANDSTVFLTAGGHGLDDKNQTLLALRATP
ncbi:MAG: hypothetical protein ACJ73S_01390, partial [Mycobacteriales bacterium]